MKTKKSFTFIPAITRALLSTDGRAKSKFRSVAKTLALTSGLAMAASITSAQSFTGLGFFTDPPVLGTGSYARGVSDNGVVVGFGFIPPANAPTTGFRALGWTEVGGMVNLGTLPGGISSTSRAISANGSVVVGWSHSSIGQRACFWDNSGPHDMGILPGYGYSQAYDVNDTGSVVVGRNGSSSTFYRAFRKTGGVMTDLGVPSGGGWVSSVAYGVSGNGLVVVGSAIKSQANSLRAFRWTGGKMTSLGTLRNGAFSEAFDANANGSVVVGTSDSGTGSRAFRWTSAGMANLGVLPGQPYSYGSYGLAVSGDGSKIVGYCSDGTVEVLPISGSQVTTGLASYWTVVNNIITVVDLNTYLAPLMPSGWTLREARGISADGTTIVGWGWHNGSPEAWVARLVP